jgi:hypothetical protein
MERVYRGKRIYLEYMIKKRGRECFQVVTVRKEYVAWEGVLWWNGSRFVANVTTITHPTIWRAEEWIQNGFPKCYPHFSLLWASNDAAGKIAVQREICSVREGRTWQLHQV